jgi:hypothetical protein
MTTKVKSVGIEVPTFDKGFVTFYVLGDTPLIFNRMTEKVKLILGLGGVKKTASERASILKHVPIEEYRLSPYTNRDEKSPTLCQHLSAAFKGAMKNAALDIPGVNKSQISRLTWVEGERIDIYGVPQLMMSVTRSADINKTPDIRTRAVIPKWACEVTVSYVQPNLRGQSVYNLMAAAGIMQGIGDWRTGKGSGTFGQFRIVGCTHGDVSKPDAEYNHILKHGGRKVQVAALETPDFYDQESEELFNMMSVEAKRRGFKAVA